MNYTRKPLVHTRPCDVADYDIFPVQVVGVALPGENWAAYRGPSDWTPEQVAQQGDKIMGECARLLFYALAMSGRRYND